MTDERLTIAIKELRHISRIRPVEIHDMKWEDWMATIRRVKEALVEIDRLTYIEVAK